MCGEANQFYWVTGAKASLKGRESHGEDPKPGDLFMGRMKSPERGMEVRTSAMYMCLDDL